MSTRSLRFATPLVLFLAAVCGASPSARAASAASEPAAPFPLGDTFALHSDPGADRILYLDFDGGSYTPGFPPNSSIPNRAATLPPFGGTTPFSDGTLGTIQRIWQRVAEDYAPFQLDVTTEEPPEDDLEGCADTCGDRISIGGAPTEIGLAPDVGGVASTGVTFGVVTLPSAFVFSAGEYTTDEVRVANTISHESGHTFGLLHDGTQPNDPLGGDYYPGSGDWCPIMGDCVLPVSQWSEGEYPGANNQEDDLAKIAAIAPERPDDVTEAVPLGGSPDAVEQPGLIGDRDDTDTFTLDSGGGPATFTVEGAAPSPNLNASLTLLNDEGVALAVADDPNGLDATLSRTLSPGRYRLRVDGVGDDDPLPGYSDYDSLGRYLITGSYTPVADQHSLSVSRQGSGTGTVDSSPAGIDCGTVCSADFDDAEVVRLTATPDVGSTFAGWSGACSGTGACSVPMTEARTVIATFDQQASATQSSVASAASTSPPGPRSRPTPHLSGHAKTKAASLLVSCGDRACLARVTATVDRAHKAIGTLTPWKRHLAPGIRTAVKLKLGKRLLGKIAGERDVTVKVRAIFTYEDGSRVTRVVVLRVM